MTGSTETLQSPRRLGVIMTLYVYETCGYNARLPGYISYGTPRTARTVGNTDELTDSHLDFLSDAIDVPCLEALSLDYSVRVCIVA